ncbi:AIPR family protein [Streptomyces indonesiensis]
MSGNTRGGRRIPREVHQVREALLREFDGLINVDDITHPDPVERQRAFLSRALAAKAARRLTDCTPEEAAATVIDGEHDFGIDAVAFSAAATEMWLIQAKWSDKGTAGFNTEAANKLVRGLKKLDNRDFDQFNERFQRLADRVQSVLNSHTCKVVLVVAVMGDGRLSTETVDILDEARQDFEGFGRTIEHQVMSSAEFHQAVREDIAPQPISLSATMATGWHHRDTPYKAYYGLVAADELARWYGEKGDALYDRNVRTSLGLTSVNQVLVESLTKDPQNFWYLHNGITVICGSITEHFFAKRAVGEPVRLELTDASVVNGAQTVTSAHRAFEQNPEAVADAYVTVRIISVKDSPEGFDRDITEATNTQNHMERRDFIAIDEVQSRIREDFKLSLDKEYVFRRGELDPPPSAAARSWKPPRPWRVRTPTRPWPCGSRDPANPCGSGAPGARTPGCSADSPARTKSGVPCSSCGGCGRRSTRCGPRSPGVRRPSPTPAAFWCRTSSSSASGRRVSTSPIPHGKRPWARSRTGWRRCWLSSSPWWITSSARTATSPARSRASRVADSW